MSVSSFLITIIQQSRQKQIQCNQNEQTKRFSVSVFYYFLYERCSMFSIHSFPSVFRSIVVYIFWFAFGHFIETIKGICSNLIMDNIDTNWLYNIKFKRFTFLSKISKYQKPVAIQFRRWKYGQTTKLFFFCFFFFTIYNSCYKQTHHSLNSHFIRAPTKISLRFIKKWRTVHICNV